MAKRMLAAVAGLGLTLGFGGCATAPDPSTLGKFGWMAGCWVSADGVNREVWSEPYGGVMFSYSGSLQGGSLAFFEQARLDTRTSPATYVVTPNGQRPATFVENPAAFAPAEGKSVTFDNPQNEYPQRIAYRTEGKEGLGATISRLDGTQPQEFHWVRCP